MSVEVVTVWAPRPGHEKWRDDYLKLIELQSRTARHFGHVHTIVTDAKETICRISNHIVVELPQNLMKAMIAGVIARLKLPCASNLVFVDVDVLVGSDMDGAFANYFEIGLTNRDDPIAPINNGVMYVNRCGIKTAQNFFQRALNICEEHWGGDQEAISKVAAPVPDGDDTKRTKWGTIAYLNMKKYGCVPKTRGQKHHVSPYAIHFKGETKQWAEEYARRFILREDEWE